MPYVFLLTDITSWWLTNPNPNPNPNFALLVIIGGGMAMAFVFMWGVPLCEMWLLPRQLPFSSTAATLCGAIDWGLPGKPGGCKPCNYCPRILREP